VLTHTGFVGSSPSFLSIALARETNKSCFSFAGAYFANTKSDDASDASKPSAP
jgi:hypothetical protein